VDKKGNSRRKFLRQAAGATLVAGASNIFVIPTAQGQTASPAGQTGTASANDTIQIGLIGAGGQGAGDTITALRVPGVELVAVSDVYDGRLVRAKEFWNKDLFTTRDFREVLARPDVDAVIIATPDHWHVPIAIAAVEAGKDVYLEKPMIHKLEEGDKLIEAQRKSNRIVQIGSQRVSSIVYKKAKELVASGAIGQLNLVEANWNRNSPTGAWQYSIPPDASPETIDWDRFLGNAPKRPFEPIRLFRWRNYRDYGTGIPGDLFVHLFSGIHFVLNSIGPTRIISTGGIRFWNDGRDVPDVMLGLYDYPKTATHPGFNLALKVNFMDGGGGEESFRFVGSEGVLSIGGGGVTLIKSAKLKEPGYTINTFPQSIQDQYLKEYRAKYPETGPELSPRMQESYVPPSGYSDLYDHFQNFFASVRSRQPVVEDPVFGFRAAGPAVLSNTANFEQRAYKWDPEAMKATPL
jgi:predicted dehydrogenase